MVNFHEKQTNPKQNKTKRNQRAINFARFCSVVTYLAFHEKYFRVNKTRNNKTSHKTETKTKMKTINGYIVCQCENAIDISIIELATTQMNFLVFI